MYWLIFAVTAAKLFLGRSVEPSTDDSTRNKNTRGSVPQVAKIKRFSFQ